MQAAGLRRRPSTQVQHIDRYNLFYITSAFRKGIIHLSPAYRNLWVPPTELPDYMLYAGVNEFNGFTARLQKVLPLASGRWPGSCRMLAYLYTQTSSQLFN